jgi:hypothetical protein
MTVTHSSTINHQSISQEILRAIEALQYGSIEITVHDGRVTQIEKREKLRFQAAEHKYSPTVKNSGKP